MTHLLGPWPVRATWAILPLVMGTTLGDALGQHSLAVARTGAVLAWGTWSGVLVAVLLPRTVSLTAVRVATPAALATANWAALHADASVLGGLAVGAAALTVVAAFAPTTGDVFVNGSSYGHERRLPLRVPGPVLLGPLPLAWVLAVAPVVAGPLLLAAEAWVPGALVLLIGLPVATLAVRSLHGLARRWLVFVPNGVVLHDHQALVEPVLFPRRVIRRLGPATLEQAGAAFDATQGAFGLALALDLVEPVVVSPRRPGGAVELVSATRVLCTPTRPGAVVQEAAARRLPIGEAPPSR